MQNISFKANLIVDSSVYTKNTEYPHKNCPDGVVESYKKFLEYPDIKRLTEGDTIKLSKCAYTERDGTFQEGEKRRKKIGWGIIMEFVSDKLQKPFIYEICFGENSSSTLSPGSFEQGTIRFLEQKFDVKIRQRRKKTAEKNSGTENK